MVDSYCSLNISVLPLHLPSSLGVRANHVSSSAQRDGTSWPRSARIQREKFMSTSTSLPPNPLHAQGRMTVKFKDGDPPEGSKPSHHLENGRQDSFPLM